jgi:hypothetical protein
MSLDPIAKVLISAGVVLLIAGVAWQLGWLQSLRLGRLPGDIRIEREGLQVYIPLTTGLLISLVFTAISWLLRR